MLLALVFVLNSVLPNTCFDTEAFELEEFEEREKEADEEKKQHPSKDEVNSAFSLIDNLPNRYVLQLYHRFKIKSKYKDHYFGVITPPPESDLS